MAIRLDPALTLKAITALFEYEDKKLREKGKENLIGVRCKSILAQVQLKDVIKKAVIRPVRVKIPHSLISADGGDSAVCLFCKSDEKKQIEDYLKTNPVDGLTRVLSIHDVRKQYSASKDRKQLLKEHSHFICDTSVLTQLYKMLGKSFADHNNCPVPISFQSPAKIRDAMLKVISSSYMHMKGQTITITVGLTTMAEDDVTENTLQGIEFAVAKFKNNWKDVHSVHMKTTDSPALPIYSKVPSEVLAYVKKKANIEDVKPSAMPKVEIAPISKRRRSRHGISNVAIQTVSIEPALASAKKRARTTEHQEDSSSTSFVEARRPNFIRRIKSTILKRS